MHILLVEDSSIQGTILKRLLQQNGYEVQWARTGADALEALVKERPALVLTDVEMPGMSGFELCSAIKRDPDTRQIPVVLLTALSHSDDVVRGLQCGADNYLTKPYEERYLLDKLASILEGGPPQEGVPVEVTVDGSRHVVPAELHQVLNLLISTYEGAVRQNHELALTNQKLVAAQQDVARRNLDLEELNRQKDQFLGMAAHDLRNPLAVILAYSQFLLKASQPVSDKRLRFMAKIRSSAEFMLSLIDDLLDISKIEAGCLDLNLASIDPMSLVRQNVELNAILAERKGIRLVLESDSPIQPMPLDAPRMEQVLNNLISNAIKFSHAGTCVTIGLDNRDGPLCIQIRDEGQGIPEAELEHLFRPFTTTSTRSTGGEKSTGLGLAIARRIVEGHHGTITVQSTVGSGTTFTVTIPRPVLHIDR